MLLFDSLDHIAILVDIPAVGTWASDPFDLVRFTLGWSGQGLPLLSCAELSTAAIAADLGNKEFWNSSASLTLEALSKDGMVVMWFIRHRAWVVKVQDVLTLGVFEKKSIQNHSLLDFLGDHLLLRSCWWHHPGQPARLLLSSDEAKMAK
jgi:hypothetical protein